MKPPSKLDARNEGVWKLILQLPGHIPSNELLTWSSQAVLTASSLQCGPNPENRCFPEPLPAQRPISYKEGDTASETLFTHIFCSIKDRGKRRNEKAAEQKMGKVLFSWNFLKWFSLSKGEGISHGILYSFRQSLPQPTPELWVKQCHFTSLGNIQDNLQVQELLPCSWLPWELTESSCPTEKGLPAEQDFIWQTARMVWPRQQSQALQSEAPLCYGSSRSWWELPSILLSENWAFFPVLTCDTSAANSQPMPTKKRKGLLSTWCF